MSVSAAELVAYFPEFKGNGSAAHYAFLDQFLAAAEARTPLSVWEDLQDQGITYLAAHLLVTSPAGVNAKLVSEKGESVYGKQRKHLARVVSYNRISSVDQANYQSL